MHYTPKIKIFINSRIDYRTVEFIQAKFLAIFSNNCIEFLNTNPEKANLIITDRYDEFALTKKVLFFRTI